MSARRVIYHVCHWIAIASLVAIVAGLLGLP